MGGPLCVPPMHATFLLCTRRLYRVSRVVATYIFLRHTREFGAPPTDDGPMFDADDMGAIQDSVALVRHRLPSTYHYLHSLPKPFSV
jgi:hypothetical protein